MAPQDDQNSRVTRQRTRELSVTNEEGGNDTTTNQQQGLIEATLVSNNCCIQPNTQNQMNTEG